MIDEATERMIDAAVDEDCPMEVLRDYFEDRGLPRSEADLRVGLREEDVFRLPFEYHAYRRETLAAGEEPKPYHKWISFSNFAELFENSRPLSMVTEKYLQRMMDELTKSMGIPAELAVSRSQSMASVPGLVIPNEAQQ